MIKSYLKNTRIWIAISHSDFYQKIRNPVTYKKSVEEKNIYKKLLSGVDYKNELIFDVGANKGDKSAIFLALTKKVIAFEPSEKWFAFLMKRFRNQNIELFNFALGGAESFLEYYEIENNEGYNSLSKKHIETTVTARGISTLSSVKSKKIKVEIIENFITRFGKPIYIKIDVEGYEYEVIKGLKSAVPIISFEANLPEFCDETIQIIEYLTNNLSDRYRFNFIAESSFLKDQFLSKEEAIKVLQTTSFRYLEIYARLEH
jgi:FkbM family methyltransferase